MRYQAKKEEAWKWEDTLTPYGTKLRKCSFWGHQLQTLPLQDKYWRGWREMDLQGD
jgi:hypothetical protein